ncbi:hypothetical protein PINS_up003155 [Pythium insidiosum]|nr:hypothetical protein PINS_up003155 [Pythium insidiosum]
MRDDPYARVVAVPLVETSAPMESCSFCVNAATCTTSVAKSTPRNNRPLQTQDDGADGEDDPERAWLVQFYRNKGLDDKIPHVAAILGRYRGRMDVLKSQLLAKYGAISTESVQVPATIASPTSPSSSSSSDSSSDEDAEPNVAFDAAAPLTRAWLEAFYTRVEPAKVARVDTVLRQFAGREEQLKSMLLAKYPMPSTDDGRPIKRQKNGQHEGTPPATTPQMPPSIPETRLPMIPTTASFSQPLSSSEQSIAYRLEYVSCVGFLTFEL